MKYMGSKQRHAKEIFSAITSEVGGSILGSKYEVWVEPFVGGANMMSNVPKMLFSRRIGIDNNLHLIEMWKALITGWICPWSVTEDEYQELKKKSCTSFTCIESPLIAFVGIGCSYSGKWFGGYARGNADNGTPRNYCKESADNVNKQKMSLLDVEFYGENYTFTENLLNGQKAIIYCDPPYQDTTKYKSSFDHAQFWRWCDKMIEKGHKVFVSEYNAPEGWRCVWQKEVNNSLTKDTGSKKGVEKLFTK